MRASARPGGRVATAASAKRPDVVRTALVDGKLYRRNADETLSPLPDETDYARLDALNVAEIERIAESDADGSPMARR